MNRLRRLRRFRRRLAIGLVPAVVLGMSAVAVAAPSAGPSEPQTVTVRATSAVLVGERASVRGTLTSADAAGRDVTIRMRRGRRWHTVATLRTTDEGRFRGKVTMPRPGRWYVRAIVADASGAEQARSRATSLGVYHERVASWYGPGLYGNHLACGGHLRSSTLGVAHKSLPCGTKVEFSYKGRTVVAPVVDRGPYVRGRDYDLTAETSRRLGFGHTGRILATR